MFFTNSTSHETEISRLLICRNCKLCKIVLEIFINSFILNMSVSHLLIDLLVGESEGVFCVKQAAGRQAFEKK